MGIIEISHLDRFLEMEDYDKLNLSHCRHKHEPRITDYSIDYLNRTCKR